MAVNSTMLDLGTVAPDFTLPDAAGDVVRSIDMYGVTGTLVAFVCNHCPYVRHIAPVFARRAEEWAAAGIGVVAINSNDADSYPDDAPARMVTQAAEWGWTFPYLVDDDQKVAHAYRAACTPDFYLFDAARRLAYRGRFDAATPKNAEPVTGDALDAAVRQVSAGTSVDVEQIPSIGCGIKWKKGNAPDAGGTGIIRLS
ncbi:thioredoxin family protein [Skermania piniformis]|uniref:Thioredoxin family protein n=1 Tax=Skermania pinensis TaxID=39122 RepID=A0ABX8SG89_9ACTN|nr:thioredoxin family protein [Skermania piniformis]QXQ14701.1 thioredoxin family protein [Skermania piniformis]